MEKPLILVLTTLALAGCTPPSTAASEARVWSTSSSSDGFASCPADTSVVGGGFEIGEGALGPGREVRVIASRPHGNGWRVDCVDERGVLTTGCKAWVVCATVLR
ncbi:MAG: hypothetical protein RMJ98_11190 [Myxococcales bacterium]|nr:hypothetical protein [Polyangiaceae bacterium]MDW8249852.1 hypothetical protein [Myxococcales bacterium]